MSEDSGKKKFPNKESRKKCWDAKENYHVCLDENNSDCSKLREIYTSLCPAVWVTHFDRKRKYELFKANVYENDPVSKLSK